MYCRCWSEDFVIGKYNYFGTVGAGAAEYGLVRRRTWRLYFFRPNELMNPDDKTNTQLFHVKPPKNCVSLSWPQHS